MINAYSRNISSKKYVGYILSHADEASEDFAECGIVFSETEETPDILRVTLPDNRCFYYQAFEKQNDCLVRIECGVEKEWRGNILAGELEIQRRKNDYVYVVVDCDDQEYWEVRSLIYRLPEFDKYVSAFKGGDTAQRISQWISTEELSALYKEGKELEEILSGYCQLKSHGVCVNLSQYTSPYEEMKLQIEGNEKRGNTDDGNG
ncbi:MAG: hypothetical protein K2N95_04205 [Lachnospiraceae bacterium]|nr:hypothetical protein [Lachnospiraceae bacterium]